MRIDKKRDFWHLYTPVKLQTGHFALVAVERWLGQKQVWNLSVPKAITVTPVPHGESVYFVAGNVLYRVNADTGAICWKQTLPLNADEALTELAFAGGEIRASGPGVLVRVAERSESQR